MFFNQLIRFSLIATPFSGAIKDIFSHKYTAPQACQTKLPEAHFHTMSKDQAIDFLEKSSEAELWNIFLEGQAQMLAPSNLRAMKEGGAWESSDCVLEIGCGAGDFLAIACREIPGKSYVGIDIESDSIERAKRRYGSLGIDFFVGDAEAFQSEFEGVFDLVVFRFTIQHLKNPSRALEIAWKYLKPGGSIHIMDSYDPSNGCSHPLDTVKDALSRAARAQEEGLSKGSRYASLNILREVQDPTSPLANIYRLVGSNLSSDGVMMGPATLVEGSDLLKRHLLLFGALVAKRYGVEFDLERHYDEVLSFSLCPNSWFCFGIHHMTLERQK